MEPTHRRNHTRNPSRLEGHRLLARLGRSLLAAGTAGSASAIIFFSTGDPEYNTTAPGGELAGSGWQFQGQWGGFTGTVIGPNCFIIAKHVGGLPGEPFYFRGTTYRTTARYDDPESDLRIWAVCGVFPEHASLYEGSDEAGRDLVLLGRGYSRGAEVTVGGLLGPELKGWKYGGGVGVLRWGMNRVEGIADGNVIVPGAGALLRADFNAGSGVNEAHLTQGDSGSGAFIQWNGEWRLAGVNFAVGGPYNFQSTGDGFEAALFDEGGLYRWSGGGWTFVPDTPAAQAGSLYMTRISARRAWILNTIATASAGLLVLESAPQAGGPYQAELEAEWVAAERRFSVVADEEMRFFRVRHCEALQIRGVRAGGGLVWIEY